MRTVYLPRDYEEELDVSALVLGNFDGVHKGHQRLFERAARFDELSSAGQSDWAVMTFEPHPREFFKDKAFFRVFSPIDGIESLKKAGLSHCIIHEFNQTLSSKAPVDFLNEVVLKVKPKAIVVGEDFYFGKNREGSVDDIVKWAQAYEIQVNVVKLLRKTDDVKISSTLIRSLLEKGDVQEANKMLLSPFFMSGKVKREKGLATELGFPTINVFPENSSNLMRGVYCSKTKLFGKSYNSITNFGVRPTVEDGVSEVIETHVLNFPHELVGISFQRAEVEFLKCLRPESRFANILELKEQIQKDLKAAEIFFK